MILSFDDEILTTALKRQFSGMLPHDEYIEEYFSVLLTQTLKLIHHEEMYGEYYVFVHILNSLRELNMAFPDSKVLATSEVFDAALENVIPIIARNKSVDLQNILASEGVSDNISLPNIFEQGCQSLYKRTKVLYDECFELGVNSEEAFNSFGALKSAFITNASAESISVQVEILNGKFRHGRYVYSGPLGWQDFMKHTTSEMQTRLDESESLLLSPTNLLEAVNILTDTASLFSPLSKYGITILDDETPILRHRLVTLCGDEGVGKSTLAGHLAANILLDGGRVLYMAGETVPSLIYTRILSSYIKKKFGKFITRTHLQNLEACNEEDQKIVKLALAEIISDKRLQIHPTFNYNTVENELESLYKSNKFDAVIIDHTKALSGGTGLKEFDKVEQVAVACRNFKKNFPVYVCVVSHLSTEAAEEVAKGKLVTRSPTRGSRILSQESDEIFVLTQDDLLKKQRLLAVQVYKRRDAAPVPGHLYLQAFMNVAHFVYDVRFQGQEESKESELIANIKEQYGSASGDYSLDSTTWGENGGTHSVLDDEDDADDAEDLFEEDE